MIKQSSAAFLIITAAMVIPTHGCSEHGTAESLEQERNPAFAVSLEVIRAQIVTDVNQVIEKTRSASSAGEAETNGYSAHEVFANVGALRNTSAWSALCSALVTLPSESLVFFDNEIRAATDEKSLPCGLELQAKLASYWKENRTLFEQHLASLANRRAGPKTGFKVHSSLEERSIPKGTTALSRSDLKNGEVILSFDGGPHPTRSLRINEILKSAGAKAHFFHIGKSIRKYDQIEHRIADEAGIIGTSGLIHHLMLRMPLAKADKDISDGRIAAESATGASSPFFRFPYDISCPELRAIAADKKMVVLPWSIDSQDWKTHDLSALYDRLISEIDRDKGGVVLFHDGEEQAVLVLPALLEELKARGFTIVVFVPDQE